MLSLILISAAGILIGLFLCFNSGLAIEIQRRFYERINWRIEPISMQKEIQNTRIMGLFLITATLSIIIYAIIKGCLIE